MKISTTEKTTIEIVPKALSLEIVPFLREQPKGSELLKYYDYNIYFLAHAENAKPIFFVNVGEENIKNFLNPYIKNMNLVNGVNEILNRLKNDNNP
jgi:hypothetical protein